MPLGVLLKNESVGEDMIDVLTHVQQYIPTFSVHIHQILFGGDQLTCERACGAQNAKAQLKDQLGHYEVNADKELQLRRPAQRISYTKKE